MEFKDSNIKTSTCKARNWSQFLFWRSDSMPESRGGSASERFIDEQGQIPNMLMDFQFRQRTTSLAFPSIVGKLGLFSYKLDVHFTETLRTLVETKFNLDTRVHVGIIMSVLLAFIWMLFWHVPPT